MFKICNKCGVKYSAETIDELATHFGYKNIKRKSLTFQCRECKRSYDKLHVKDKRSSELKKYKESVRAETKKTIKSKYPCAVVNCKAQAEIHHFDYTDPLAVIPVCRVHHSAIHRLNKLLEETYD